MVLYQPLYSTLLILFDIHLYSDIMVLPTFKRYIYASFSQKVDGNDPEAELFQARIQAWFNVMQITFLVLQYTKSKLKDLGILAFRTLLNCYFTKKNDVSLLL